MARDSKKKGHGKPKVENTPSPRGIIWATAAVVLAFVVFLLSKLLTSDEGGNDDWKRLKHWMIQHGAQVHDGLSTKEMPHGGNNVRGMVTNVAIEANTVILRVPKRLWVTESLLRDPGVVSLESIEECAGEDAEQLMLALAVALEIQKGSSAFHATYLETLPSRQDYSTFHPMLAEKRVQDDFGGLPLLHDLKADWDEEIHSWEQCFRKWKPAILAKWRNHPIESLTFDNLLTGRFHVKTRSLFGTTILPMFDLTNTAAEHQNNAKSQTTRDNIFEVKTTKKVAAGSELLYLYTNECDNEGFLAGFGFYLEDNSRGLNSLGRVNCSSLKPHALAELQTEPDSVSLALSSGWRAPRCRPVVGSSGHHGSTQSALRCSLARLAWESCAESWGHSSWRRSQEPPTKAALRDHSKAHSNLGVALAESGDLIGAEDRLREAIRVNPALSEPHYNLATILARQNRDGEALKVLQAGQALDPRRSGDKKKR